MALAAWAKPGYLALMRRREFLHVTIASAALAACGDDEPNAASLSADDVFPQGVASGDPRPDAVLLWTRVEPWAPDAVEPATFQVALDAAFQTVVVSGDVEAAPEADHTVRVRATGLKPRTVYYYRFRSRGVVSPVGRTKTAPAPEDDGPRDGADLWRRVHHEVREAWKSA